MVSEAGVGTGKAGSLKIGIGCLAIMEGERRRPRSVTTRNGGGRVVVSCEPGERRPWMVEGGVAIEVERAGATGT